MHSDGLDFSVSPRSWWHASARIPAVSTRSLATNERCDVAIVGAGFTGLSTALRLATTDSALRVCVIEAGEPGWGASGRNGGFCCLGGSALSIADIAKKHGLDDARAFHSMQARAIEHVAHFGKQHGLTEDFSEPGELWLAHNSNSIKTLHDTQDVWQRYVNMPSTFLDEQALSETGFNTQTLKAGLYIDKGYGLHPLNYVRALAQAAVDAGVTIYSRSPLIEWAAVGSRHQLKTPRGRLNTDHIVFATNGYTPEERVTPLAGRILPVLSSILVTRPLTDDELAAQGFTRTVMSYDTQNLLHYFRLLPDRRMLFGGRGGVNGADGSLSLAAHGLRQDFDAMFPAWRHVPHTHNWRGYVCLSSTLSPYVGMLSRPNTSSSNCWAALGYHGNGVAMAGYCGWNLADLIRGKLTSQDLPRVITTQLPVFTPPRLRPLYLKAAYGMRHVLEKLGR